MLNILCFFHAQIRQFPLIEKCISLLSHSPFARLHEKLEQKLGHLIMGETYLVEKMQFELSVVVLDLLYAFLTDE